MKRATTFVVSIALLAAPAVAADRSLAVTIDGRPLSRGPSTALFHRDAAYADVDELVRSFGGLVTSTRGTTTVTLAGRSATFAVGRPSVVLDGRRIALAHPAFVVDRRTYVPLDFFITRIARGSLDVDATAATARISTRP